jgi:signal transduction histidine kinase
MQKRVVDLEGDISFLTNNPKGTCVEVQIPILTKDA